MASIHILTRACIGHFFRCANWHSLRSLYANLLHSKNANDAGVMSTADRFWVINMVISAMEKESDYVIDLYFECNDVKSKRAIANLFRYKLQTNSHPPTEILLSYFDKFKSKLKKIDAGRNIDFGFYSHVLFGVNYGPLVSFPQQGPASLTLVQGGYFGKHAADLIDFLCSLDSTAEVAATVFDIAGDFESWLCLRKCSDQELESRQFKIDKGRSDFNLLTKAAGTYQWLQESVSFGSKVFSEPKEQCLALAKNATGNIVSQTSKIPENYQEVLTSLLISYDVVTGYNNETIDCQGDAYIFFESTLQDKAPNHVISYPEVQGGWDQGELVSEYASLILNFCKKANVSIEKFAVSPPFDSKGNEDPYQNMSISFLHDRKSKKWSFNIETEGEYFKKFSQWAKTVLNGGYIWFSEDYYRGYILPKELIQELNKLGIYGDG